MTCWGLFLNFYVGVEVGLFFVGVEVVSPYMIVDLWKKLGNRKGEGGGGGVKQFFCGETSPAPPP